MTSQLNCMGVSHAGLAGTDAKARFSEFLDTCLEDGPQIVFRRSAEAAVLMPIA
jgi:prevent-host-death family protein